MSSGKFNDVIDMVVEGMTDEEAYDCEAICLEEGRQFLAEMQILEQEQQQQIEKVRQSLDSAYIWEIIRGAQSKQVSVERFFDEVITPCIQNEIANNQSSELF